MNEHEPRGRGWLRYLERKLSLPGDDWSRAGTPAPAWDNRSGAPTTNWYRFDAIGVATTVALAVRAGTMSSKKGVALLDGVCERLVRYHGFNEWVEQRGPDPARAEYPAAWQGTLVPDELWGRYDSPGWAGNGTQAAGFQVNPIEAQGAIYYKGFLNYVLGLRAILDPERDGSALLEIVYDAEHTFRYSHRDINAILTEDFADALRGISQGLCCEIHKLWPL